MTLSEHEQQMVRQAMAGDERAFAFLVGQFSRLVYAHAYTLLGDRQEAEDVTQECFLRAFRFRVRLEDPAKFPYWLLAIARNLARDRYRQRHAVQSLDDPAQAQPVEDATPVMREIGEIVRESVMLNFREGQSPEGDDWEPSKRAIEEKGKT